MKGYNIISRVEIKPKTHLNGRILFFWGGSRIGRKNSKLNWEASQIGKLLARD